jgi:hypothetical protein
VEGGPRSCPAVRGVIHALPLFSSMVALVQYQYDGQLFVRHLGSERIYVAEHVINYLSV